MIRKMFLVTILLFCMVGCKSIPRESDYSDCDEACWRTHCIPRTFWDNCPKRPKYEECSKICTEAEIIKAKRIVGK